MNDTHVAEGQGWYGFGLDGTLAVYDEREGIDHIGKPVKRMVDLMKRMHEEGKVVKILTARVAPRSNVETKLNPYLTDKAVYDVVGRENEEKYADVYRKADWTAYEFIVDWCLKNLGFLPEITHEKDHLMIALYDDRVKQVVPDKGLLVEDLYHEAVMSVEPIVTENLKLRHKLESEFNGFSAGFVLAAIIALVALSGIEAYDRWFSERDPVQIRLEKAHDVLCNLLKDWPEEAR